MTSRTAKPEGDAGNDFHEHASLWSGILPPTSVSKALESGPETVNGSAMVPAPLHPFCFWLPLLIGVMAFAHPSVGQTITGRVVGVSDGDSLKQRS